MPQLDAGCDTDEDKDRPPPRTDRKTGEKKVIAVRHMLQPSKHPLVKDYEKAQDSAGAAFSVVNLQRGERRAAAIRHEEEWK